MRAHHLPYTQPPFPEKLMIETTTRCNLRCKQCARLVNKYALADMAMDTFARLRPLFPHVKEAALYGHGETFLHKQFFFMLAELKKHGIFVYVTSNGTLITPDVAERLVELQLDRLSISLDAATPELFNEIRRGADFQAVLQNIQTLNLIKKRIRRDDKPILSIMYCAMKHNIQELPKLMHLADQLNMLHGVAMINIVEYDETTGEEILRYPELAERYVNEAYRLAQKLAIPLGIPTIFDNVVHPVQLSIRERIYRTYREFQRSFDKVSLFKLKFARLRDRILKTGTQTSVLPEQSTSSTESGSTIRVKNCRDPWEFMFINVHGEVRVCCASDRIMGNVHDNDILSIWNGKTYQAFREQVLTPDPPEECLRCPMRGWHEIEMP